MKIKPKKKVSPERLKHTADELGKKYAEASEAIKAIEKDKNEANQAIKSLAARHGLKKGHQYTIEGTAFTIGFTEIPSFSVDEAKGAKLIKPVIWERCFTRSFDSRKFGELVEKQEISRKTAEAIMVKGETQQRVIVQKRKI